MYYIAPLSDTRKAELQSSRDNLAQVISVLDAVLNGKLSQSQAAKQLHLTNHMFQYYLRKHFSNYIQNHMKFEKSDILALYAMAELPSHRILRAVFEIEEPYVDFPTYQEHDFYHSYLSILQPQEKEILLYLYGNQTDSTTHTLQEAGHQFGVTREYIRIIRNKALYTLRNKQNLLLLYPKLKSDFQLDKAVHDLLIGNLSREREFYHTQTVEFLKNRPDIRNYLKQLIQNIETSSDDTCIFEHESNTYPENNTANQSVFQEDLSTRTRNVLQKAHIRTIADLRQFTSRNDILQLKNAGEKTADEIIAVMQKYNLM